MVDHTVKPQQGQSTSLGGQVALITGATSGIGLATAQELAARGATVIFGVRNEQKGHDVARQIKASNQHAKLIIPPQVPTVDFNDLDSVRRFGMDLAERSNLPIDILINNAGISELPKSYGPGHVGALVLVNYLGPYLLTRLLEKKLMQCKSRVVNLSSVTHRSFYMQDPDRFLHAWWSGQYPHTKLALALFAYELQRRLGPLGVQSVAVDPGGVRTAIWSHTPILQKQPIKAIIENFYAPPEDAAITVVHAATVPWELEKKPGVAPENDLRFYAKGLFASPFVTRLDGAWSSWLKSGFSAAYGFILVVHSVLDYPLRHLTHNRLASKVVLVPSSPQTYDKVLAKQLWDLSAVAAGVPREALADMPKLTDNLEHPRRAANADQAMEPAGAEDIKTAPEKVNVFTEVQ